MRGDSRLHAPHLRALVVASEQPGLLELRAPQPGIFIPLVVAGDLVAPEALVGHLDVLGRTIAVVAGEARGLAVDPGVPRAVGHGDRLLKIDPEATLAAVAAAIPALVSSSPGDLVFRAPTSGRYYGRPTPERPPFVIAGAELGTGATVCLLEVMKTFHRVAYAEAPVRVRAVLVADGDDVNAGDPLLALEPL